MLKKLLKQRNKKGFTLIELIVVLVILAILAAAAIPAMMGYVNNAKKASYLADCRAVYIAVQSAVTEARATTQEASYVWSVTELPNAKTLDKSKVSEKINSLLGSTPTITYAPADTAPETGAAQSYQISVKGTKLDDTEIVKIRYFYETDKYVELEPGEGTNVWTEG